MNRPLRSRIGYVGAVALGLATSAISIQPLTFDFGSVAVNGLSQATTFHVTIPTGAGPRDTITTTVAGPDATSFVIMDDRVGGGTQCEAWAWRSGSCTYTVLFGPKSLGPKLARLEVTDSRGGVAKATLTGTGVAAVCTNNVVFCNYAHLYSGTFNWSSNLMGPNASHSENVAVTVTLGVAACNGAVTDTFEGKSRTGAVTGTGLIGVEFLDSLVDPTTNRKEPVYRITVACPSPAFPAASAYEPAILSRPAELGAFSQETYKQPIAAVGLDLVGSYSIPSPDNDPANGVSGVIRVHWSLKRS
jgi:hypothetical protein